MDSMETKWLRNHWKSMFMENTKKTTHEKWTYKKKNYNMAQYYVMVIIVMKETMLFSIL